MNLPTSVGKRDILAKKKDDPETLKGYAELFEEEGYFHDAVDFHIAAGDTEKLKVFYEKAFKEGDVFAANRIALALGKDLTSGEWETLGDNARQAGKLIYAQRAYAKAEAGGKLEAVRKEIAEAFGEDAAYLRGI